MFKRYTVVVVGLAGTSAAQRSEISHHRRERDALASAADERDRLTVAQGVMARNYRVVVERDGMVVEEFVPDVSREIPTVLVTSGTGGDAEPPYDTGEMALVVRPVVHDVDVAPGGDATSAPDTSETPDPDPGVVRGGDEPAPGDTAPAPQVRRIRIGRISPDPDPERAPAAEADDPATTVQTPPARRPQRLPTWDEVPSGPVPDDVLRYFESAVAREERRRIDRNATPPEPPAD